MGLNYKLTWVQRGTTGRWRKLYKGRWLSYSGDGGKVASYPIAWQRFQEDKARIEQEVAANNPLLNWIDQQQDDILKNYCDSQAMRQAWQVLDDARPLASNLGDKGKSDDAVVAALQAGLSRKVRALLEDAVRADDIGKPYFDRGDVPPLEKLYSLDDLKNLQVRISAGLGDSYHQQSDDELRSILEPLPAVVRKAPPKPPAAAPWERRVTTPDSRPLKLMVERFLDSKLGDCSDTRLNQIRMKLEHFCDHLGDDIEVGSITSAMLGEYKASLAAKVSAEEWKPKYANDHTQAVGQFFNWLFESELIEEKPRLLQGKSFRFEVPNEEPDPATIEECHQILLSANSRVRLYALLMLNCGFTQIDISDLRQSEVDWKQGIITRKRSKTRKGKNSGKIPKISYQLWPETLELLKAHRSSDAERVLVSEAGTPLVQKVLIGRAKTSNTDLIRNTWLRLQKSTKLNVCPKKLRKTAANELNKNPAFKVYQYDILGNVPDGVAAKHYVQFDQAGFAKALEWLRTRVIPRELLKEPKKPAKAIKRKRDH